MIKNFIGSHKLLLLIILLAALLRFVGTSPGYPPIHTDEGISHSQGIAMILEKTLDPKHGYGMSYNYPIIVPLINAIFYLFIFIPLYSLVYLSLHLGDMGNLINAGLVGQLGGIFEVNILGQNKINVVFWGRYVTALFGTAVVFMTYLLGKRLFSSITIGLLAAFFTAINYRQVLNSHFGLPDIYNAFFLLLTLYLIILLWEKQTLKKFLLVGVGIAVYFSTKFQLFALPPLFLVLIFLAVRQKNWKKRYAYFFNWPIFLMVGTMIIITLVLNIFHLLHYRETFEQVGYSSLKYRYGRMMLDVYSLSYLYHIGIGQVASVLTLFGILLGAIFRFRQMLFLLSVIIPFLWMMVYYTGGGFYTRNFVTITPLLLICTAFAIWQIFKIFEKNSPYLAMLSSIILILVVSYQSLINSYLVPLEYSKSWNYTEVQLWLSKNLPRKAIVLTDASMVLPEKQLKVVKAKSADDYSLLELQKNGIEWVVINTDWFSGNFLWWMQVDTADGLKYWNKPTNLLLDSPLAKTISELKDYVVFEALNPWQASDNNYLVIKVPPKDGKDNFSVIKSNFNPEEHLFLNSNGGM